MTSVPTKYHKSTSSPECLCHTASHGSVGGTEQLHDHAVADALEALDHDPLDKSEAHEDDQPLDKVEADPNETLTVEAEQHHPLTTKPV